MWPRLQCVALLLVPIALLFQTASADHDYNAVHSNELNATITPCRSWIFPCGGGVYQCSTQDIYYSFTYGPQPGCPTLQNFTATPPPETTCSLANNSCSFVAGAPTCVSWLQDCNYEYSCVTEEEFSAATSGGEVVCSFPSAPPPNPDSVCIPVNTTCKWYDPCRTWQGWCGGEYMCGTESEYAAFIHGPQPLCVTPSPNATEPVPEAECVYQNGRCVWSECVSWLSPCQTSWECGSDYEYRVAQAYPQPACPYPGEYFVPPPEPAVCQFVPESGRCEFHGEPECTGGQEYQSCGTACPRTCENYQLDFACLEVCVPGCFCPDDKVLHEGECISSSDCPTENPCGTLGSPCAPGYECLIYEETGEAYCSPNCLELNPCDPHERCVLTNVTCVRSPCPPILSCEDACSMVDCASGYECLVFVGTGEAYCSPNCEELNPCATDEQCVTTTIYCIRAPCPPVLSCEAGNCAGGKEWQECGTACPLSCTNYSTPFGCTEQCVQGCFCPDGTVLSEDGCVAIPDCPNYISPCATILCAQGYTCQVEGTTGYCEPACDSLYGYGLCPEGGKCELVDQECPEEEEPCPRTYKCVQDVCTGGKEWQDCGTACPLTCDNYDNPPLVCTLQCVQGCFCPDGKADLNGVCVEPASCSYCDGCKEGETCTVVNDGGYQNILCKGPTTVPCSPEYVSRCPGNSRCVTHIVTGDSFCLESCYLGNGGCPDDQVCYYERVDEECDQLLEPCFKTACTDVPDDLGDLGNCLIGWEYDGCASACPSTCEDYLNPQLRPCIGVCESCQCPPGMAVFRDRCVDPLECYILMKYSIPLNPLPQPENVLLIEFILVGVSRDTFDGPEFATSVYNVLREYSVYYVAITVYAVLEQDGHTVAVLKVEGDADILSVVADLLIDSHDKFSVEVAAVSVVGTPMPDDDDDDDDDDNVPAAVVAGSIVAVIALCSVLLLIFVITVTIIARTYKLKARHVTVDGKEKPVDTVSYISLVSKSSEKDYELS